MKCLNNSIVNAINDFKEYIHYCSVNKKIFDKYSSPFIATTENLYDYLNIFDIDNKDCLTVTSSGDQLINLALKGANSVDCFDINIITYYYTKLKIAALKALEIDEFIDFFSAYDEVKLQYSDGFNERYAPVNKNSRFFNYDLYTSKIKKYLESQAIVFFDELYEFCDNNGNNIVEHNLINISCKILAVSNNIYLQSKEDYQKARIKISNLERCNKINFYQADFKELQFLTNKYDVIILSNISSYIRNEERKKFNEFIKEKLDKILKTNGEILVAYEYNAIKKKNESHIKCIKIEFGNFKNKKYKLIKKQKNNDELIKILGNNDFELIKKEILSDEIITENYDKYLIPSYHMDSIFEDRSPKDNGHKDLLLKYKKV